MNMHGNAFGRFNQIPRPRRIGRAAVAVLASLALAACSKTNEPRNTDWELLGNSPEMQHHSELAQIDEETVGRLGLAWSVEMPAVDGLVGNPLVKDGIVFQSGPLGRIFANDVRTGKALWTYEPEINYEGLSLSGVWSWRYNRGPALSGNLVIVAQACSLVAVDQKTGKKKWEAQSCDSKQMYGITAAPRVGGGLVFTGNACMDSGTTRGYVDAFDAATGKHKWRFFTVPGDPALPPEDEAQAMAAKTWGTDWYSKTKGCGSAWDGMTYDPVLDLLYIGVGGPSPFNPALRAKDAGDELFTNSIVAVNAKTGKYVWHFKQVPQDAWNYDATMGIMVANLPVDGKDRRVLINVPKNGFFYILDAKTGKFLSGNRFTQVTWAKGLDKNGRPIVDPAARYWEKPGSTSVVLPSPMGAHGWEALAFSPKDNLVYIPAMTMPTVVKTDADAKVGGTSMDFYYGSSGDPKWKAFGEVIAWDPIAQKERWRQRQALPVNGGLLHTGGNLVFQGTADGLFEAFDGKTGKKLWSQQVGGAIRGAPTTVMVDGEQYVLVATGNGNAAVTGSYMARYTTTPRTRTPPRLLAFKLDGKAPMPQLADVTPMAKPPVPRFEPALARSGQGAFEQNVCVDCHGMGAESVQGSVPDLRHAPPPDVQTFKDIVIGGALLPNGMPRFAHLPPKEAEAIYAFIINEAWDAYDAQQKSAATAPKR